MVRTRKRGGGRKSGARRKPRATAVQTSAPKPPAGAAREPPPAKPPQEIAQLGPPPVDPLEQQAYLYKLLVLSAYDVARDEGISSRERRKELRTISASAAKLMPRARLWQAEQLVLANRRELTERAKAKRGAKLEPRPPRSEPASSPPPAPDEPRSDAAQEP